MHYFARILKFYINSNIHVALAGFCITKITLLKYGGNDNFVPLFVGLSIIVSYNFIRFFELKTKRLRWLKEWFKSNFKLLLVVSIVSILGLFYILFFSEFNWKSLIVLFPFAFMTIFYVIPLFKVGKHEFSFRNFPSIKIFSIAIAWAGISVFFPLVEAEIKITSAIVVEFIQRILILLAITIPFDIRDVNSDSKSLKTLPQVIGENNSKIVGSVFLVLFVLLNLLDSSFLISDSIIATITMFFLWFSDVTRARYYTSFWVESIPILWVCLIIYF